METTGKDVSVVILTYNGLVYLDACLKSVLDQDMPPDVYDVWIVDNASTDGSADYVREHFPQVRVVGLDRNYGYAAGNNRALDLIKSRYLAFLNQDTVVHKQWLSTLLTALDSSVEVKACHSSLIHSLYPEFSTFDRIKMPDCAYVAELSRFGFVRYLTRPRPARPIETLFLSGASFIIDRTVLGNLGGYLFEEKLGSYCEDIELALRLHGAGYKVLLVPDSVMYHHQSVVGKPQLTTAKRASLIIRNRFMAYYLNMHLPEFLLYLPWLLAGSPLKPGAFKYSLWQKVIFEMGLVPITLWALVLALGQLPHLRHKRKQNLSWRVGGKFRLLQDLLQLS